MPYGGDHLSDVGDVRGVHGDNSDICDHKLDGMGNGGEEGLFALHAVLHMKIIIIMIEIIWKKSKSEIHLKWPKIRETKLGSQQFVSEWILLSLELLAVMRQTMK